MIEITCQNGAGQAMAFASGLPFVLTDADGVTEAKAQNLTTVSPGVDGASWQASRMEVRNIVLTLRDAPGANHTENREALFALFRFKERGTLVAKDGDRQRQIGYIVESVACDPDKKSNAYTVSLLCPSPFFTGMEALERVLGGTVSAFQFSHEFQGEEAFGERGEDRFATIENGSAMDGVGVTITIETSGVLINPWVRHVETGEALRLGQLGKNFTLYPGQRVTITTGRGEKRAVREDGQSVTRYMTEDSEFLQLSRGTNTFACGAASGEGGMTVRFIWNLYYASP